MNSIPCKCRVPVLQHKLTSSVTQHSLISLGRECSTRPLQHPDFNQKRRKENTPVDGGNQEREEGFPFSPVQTTG